MNFVFNYKKQINLEGKSTFSEGYSSCSNRKPKLFEYARKKIGVLLVVIIRVDSIIKELILKFIIKF